MRVGDTMQKEAGTGAHLQGEHAKPFGERTPDLHAINHSIRAQTCAIPMSLMHTIHSLIEIN